MFIVAQFHSQKVVPQLTVLICLSDIMVMVQRAHISEFGKGDGFLTQLVELRGLSNIMVKDLHAHIL